MVRSHSEGADGKIRRRDQFSASPGQGLWRSGGTTEKDNIAVIEVMADELDQAFWRSLRRRLQEELSQDEIVIRAQEISRL
jgi:hypothetical protein